MILTSKFIDVKILSNIKHILIPFILLIISINFSFGQSDSIFIVQKPTVYHFYQRSRILKLKEVKNIMKSNEKSYRQIKCARLMRRISYLTAASGGFLFGYQLGRALTAREPNLKFAGVGIGLAILSISLEKKFFKKVRKAINTYNSGLSPT